MEGSPRRVAVIGRLGIHPMSALPLPGRRILAFLAVHDEPVSRSSAAAQLWPERPDREGRTNLRRALWQLPRGWVVAVGEELMLDAVADVTEARAAAARAIGGALLTMSEIEMLSDDLLPGWHEEWSIQVHDDFRLLRIQALEVGCRTLSDAGQFVLAERAGVAALHADPLRESAAEALISAHLVQGNRYEAARCFRDFAQLLYTELGVAPRRTLIETLKGMDMREEADP